MNWPLFERERTIRAELRAASHRTFAATCLRAVCLAAISMLPALVQGEPAAWFVSGAAFLALTQEARRV